MSNTAGSAYLNNSASTGHASPECGLVTMSEKRYWVRSPLISIAMLEVYRSSCCPFVSAVSTRSRI